MRSPDKNRASLRQSTSDLNTSKPYLKGKQTNDFGNRTVTEPEIMKSVKKEKRVEIIDSAGEGDLDEFLKLEEDCNGEERDEDGAVVVLE